MLWFPVTDVIDIRKKRKFIVKYDLSDKCYANSAKIVMILFVILCQYSYSLVKFSPVCIIIISLSLNY